MQLIQKVKDFFGRMSSAVDMSVETPLPSVVRKKVADDAAKVHVSNPTIVKFWLIGAGIVFLAYIAFQSLEFLYLVLTAYILSIALEAIVTYLFNK